MAKIKRPTPASVARAVLQIKNNPKAALNNLTLKKLLKRFPHNTRLDEIYLKVVALNELYSTNIYDPYTIARNILRVNIDNDLERNSLAVVKDQPVPYYTNLQR